MGVQPTFIAFLILGLLSGCTALETARTESMENCKFPITTPDAPASQVCQVDVKTSRKGETPIGGNYSPRERN